MGKYLTQQEVVERWQNKFGYSIKIKTLSQWRYRKKGPKYIKLFGIVKYSENSLIEYEKTILKGIK